MRTMDVLVDPTPPQALDPPGLDAARPTRDVATPAGARVATLVRALAGIAVVGAALAQALALASARWLLAFTVDNDIGTRTRDGLMIATGVGAAVGGAVGVFVWWRRRASNGVEQLDLIARFAAPLALVGLLPGLFVSWNHDHTLELALAMAVVVIALEPLVRMHLVARARLFADAPVGAFRRRARVLAHHTLVRRLPLALVVAGTTTFAVYVGFFSVRSHWHFNTFNYDLGQIDNIFYNAIHGHPMRCSPLIREGNWTELRNHAELVVFFLSPFYALAPRAETLLILQAVIVASGALPLYRFSARRLPRATASVIALAYLAYAPMHGAVFFDVHFQPIAAAFVLWAIDMFDDHRRIPFVIFFVLALACREDICIGFAVFGLFLLLTGHRPKAGAAITAVGVTYFVVMRFAVMPSFGGWGFQDIYRQLFAGDDHSFRGVVRTLVSNPLYSFQTLLTADKLRYALQVLVPVAFLPLRRLSLWLAVLPGFFFTLLTTAYGPTTEITYQYSAHFAAYLFPAAAVALAAFGNTPTGIVRRHAALVAMIMGSLFITAQWGGFPPREHFRSGYGAVNFRPVSAQERQKRHDLQDLAALVPPDAKLAVSDRELPHLSNRIDCYTLIDGYEGSDFIIYVPDSGPGRDGVQVQRALASGQYEEIARRPGLSLLHRKDVRRTSP